ncbi:hypothetical protein I7I53_02032 [Histoplasma capsulatum var. duboisii H88]|uniref:Uncharacterized protein n=1 Tax=Ajellomyces capsulatus (strain H88) TaxID=544711 RepID=A0A8A1LKE5_AJEC8|nr:hypothetical protein I7I53_02032 [Histoplasma capsulatum var. duboisii H88]
MVFRKRHGFLLASNPKKMKMKKEKKSTGLLSQVVSDHRALCDMKADEKSIRNGKQKEIYMYKKLSGRSARSERKRGHPATVDKYKLISEAVPN